jgi:ribosomal protein L37E
MSSHFRSEAPYDEARVRAMQCPHCGAASGRRCRTSQGNIIPNGYHARRKAEAYPGFNSGKRGMVPAAFEVTQVACTRCGETAATAPHRGPFRSDIDPPGCTVCIGDVWARHLTATE